VPAGATPVIGPLGQTTGGVLFHDAVTAHAYSIATDAFASVANGYSFPQLYARGCMVVVRDATTSMPRFHSLLTGQWYGLPPNGFVTTPQRSELGAALAVTGGFAGFATWNGAWVTGPGTPASALNASEQLARHDTQTLYAFDPVRGRWLSAPWNNSGRDDATTASVLAAIDDVRAIGFGVHAGTMDAVTLPEPPWSVHALGEVGVVATDDHLLAYSGLGQVVAWNAFPFDAAAVAIGTTVTLQCRVPAGGIVVLGLGPALAAPVALPFGELWLDLPLTATVVMAAPPGESRALLPVPIPALPSLRNSAWLVQPFTLPAAGTPWLGAATGLRVL
jgi:hypothetical protein